MMSLNAITAISTSRNSINTALTAFSYFGSIEGIRRKPVPPKYEGYVHAAGLMLLLMLMVYVTGQDVLRIFMRSN